MHWSPATLPFHRGLFSGACAIALVAFSGCTDAPAATVLDDTHRPSASFETTPALELSPTDDDAVLVSDTLFVTKVEDVVLSHRERTPRARGITHPISPLEAVALSRENPGVRLPGGPPLVVFMQRNGGTYYGGNSNDSSQNRSTIVPGNSAQVGAFTLGNNAWQEVMDCTTEMFSRFNVLVTDVEPTSGAYIESVVGGHSSQLGLPNGVGGVAPIDPYQCNLIERAIVYTFTQNLPQNAQVVCEVVAQEVAHAMSLDHQYLCTDPMSYLDGCGNKEFRDEDAQCGEYNARQCNCNRPSQNSVQILLQKLGPSDGTPPPPPPPPDDIDPTAAIISPSDQETLPANTQIQVVATAQDNNALSSVELEWDFSGSRFGCPASGQGWSCTQSGDTRTWTLNVSTGTRTFRVRARDFSNNTFTTESRTISLGTEPEPGTPTPEPSPTPEPPPTDTSPPDADILAPQNGATLPAYEPMTVVANVVDDDSVAAVNLVWDFSGDAFPCPYQSQAVQCVQEGTEYTWTISVGIGDRSFQVQASDSAGNTMSTASRTITLSQAQIPPPAEDDDAENDDTFDTAVPLACGSSVDQIVVAGDDDWFRIATASGVQVTATVESSASIELRASTAAHSSTTVAAGTDALVFVAPGEIGLRLRSSSTADYRLTVTCAAPPSGTPEPTPETAEPSTSPEGSEPAAPTPAPEGEPDASPESVNPDIPRTPGINSQCACAQTERTAPLAFLALFGLVALTRRRRR